MNKREIAEIKRQFTVFNCSIARICGCYVDAEKNIKADFREAFLSLPEEEIFKYFEIFRKGIYFGRIGSLYRKHFAGFSVILDIFKQLFLQQHNV